MLCLSCKETYTVWTLPSETLWSMVLSNDNPSLWTFKAAVPSSAQTMLHNHFLTWEPLYTLCIFIVSLHIFFVCHLKKAVVCAYCNSASMRNLNQHNLFASIYRALHNTECKRFQFFRCLLWAWRLKLESYQKADMTIMQPHLFQPLAENL